MRPITYRNRRYKLCITARSLCLVYTVIPVPRVHHGEEIKVKMTIYPHKNNETFKKCCKIVRL